MPVRRLPASTNSIYLTFDDGPDPHWTPRVLAALERHHAQASFFVIGRLARQWMPLLRQAHAAGHAIGNHGWSHRHPWTLGPAHAAREIADGADAIAQALGSRPAWFRPPHGRTSPWLLEAAAAQDQKLALWAVSAVDWGPFGAPGLIAQRVAAARAGDIVLLHDGPSLRNRPASTVAILPAVLARLQYAGIEPMALPDVTLAA